MAQETAKHYIVGQDRAAVTIIREPDPYFWERIAHAEKRGVDHHELGDEPDHDIRIDMDWSDIHEEEQ